ncbi:MAG TPA: adenylate kinase [Pyrinomonadaceae bacterium]|nr:adenylate kinase [Pyrinomonadaceae bacterium]
MSKIVVLMGAPGAGKGTQARLLQERLHLPQISTGEIFRALKHEQSALAEEVRTIMSAGRLVPDDVTIRVVRERTSKDDCRDGYVLDGFPRTPAQASMLDDLAREQDKEIQAIELRVPIDTLVKRMTGRRSCPICGELYNVYFKPPKNDNVCDFHPEALLVQRADDNLETVQARLATYEEQTKPLLAFYESAGKLSTLDGTRDSEQIYEDIANIVIA